MKSSRQKPVTTGKAQAQAGACQAGDCSLPLTRTGAERAPPRAGAPVPAGPQPLGSSSCPVIPQREASFPPRERALLNDTLMENTVLTSEVRTHEHVTPSWLPLLERGAAP